MTRQQRRIFIRSLRRAGLLSLVVVIGAILPADVRGFGLAQYLTEKSLPEATIDVIDPESGTSGGGGSGEIRLEDGDIILFRFALSALPDGRNRGVQSYLTEYVPPGTEVVGVRFIDKNGLTVKPRYPGLATDGCSGGGAQCNSWPTRAGGSIAHLHADTGIFWTADTRLTPLTDTTGNRANRFISPTNGVEMNARPSGIQPDLTQIIEFSAPYMAHNLWDLAQVEAFGSGDFAPGGDGNTPFRYGSPVAGPFTYYDFEATDTDASVTGINIALSNTVGPWRRVRYPGSKIGFGAATCTSLAASRNNCGCISDNGVTCTSPAPDQPGRKLRDILDTGVPAGSEWNEDLTPATAVTARAIRYAMGEARPDEAMYAEVALRVVGDPPIDAFFDEDGNSGNGISGGNVDCAEVFGSHLSTRTPFGSFNDGNQNPWVSYLPTSQCVFLRLLFDMEVTPELSSTGIQTKLDVANLKLTDETNVVVYLRFENNEATFASANPPADGPPAACPAQLDPSGTKECIKWTVGTLPPGISNQLTFTVNSTPGGGGHIAAVLTGFYTSDSLPLSTAGFRTEGATMVKQLVRPRAALLFPTPTTTPASLGNDSVLTGVVSNLAGTSLYDLNHYRLVMPSGWTARDTGGAATADVTIGGGATCPFAAARFECASDCATSSPVFAVGRTLTTTGTCNVSVTVRPATSPSPGLYPVDVALSGSTGFAGDTETYFAEAAIVPLGAVRTTKPVLDCPIGSTDTSINGTSEPNADISVKFSLIERGTGTADGAGDWSVTNYTGFGGMYGGLEVRATATAPGELESEPSDACFVVARRQCSDGVDNDLDGFTDFPADVGCDSLTDNDEANTDVEECRDEVNNDADANIDWPADLQCYGPYDDTEAGNPACSDGIDNDLDGNIDFPADDDCTGAGDATEEFTRECQDRRNNADGDTNIDFEGAGNPANADADCHSAFDDDEGEPLFQPPDVRGRILIVFDTSGSMNWNVCEDVFTNGDGSVDFAGDDVDCLDLPPLCAAGQQTCSNGLADDSRLYKVKQGIVDVVASFGEVEYALMRFHQRPVDFGPPRANASMSSGGWQGGGARVGDPAQCSGGFDAGDVLVSFSDDNYQTMIDWMDGDTNYPDGVPPPGYDEELRGTGTTPLAGSLTSALTYLQDTVDGGNPTTEACRQYRVILVTDGEDTCSVDPITDPPAAALALSTAGFPVTVIGFATGDPTVQTRLDAIAQSGGTGQAIFVSDQATLSAAMADVVAGSIRVEVCNGIDDDCDGLIDEGFNLTDPLDPSDDCNNGELGVCFETGELVCTADGSGTYCDAPDGTPTGTDQPPEPCNNLDDDCDGLIDEGLTCTCLAYEICNGIDDDCDGQIDEDIAGEGDDCGIDIGACEFGQLVCDGTLNPPRLVCENAVDPDTESCNCIDDDCDTQTDEGSRQCYDVADGGCTFSVATQTWTCLGLCQTGLKTCDVSACPAQGGEGACNGDAGKVAELCNGFDDDCDGPIDEDFTAPQLVPGLGDTCDNGQQGVCYEEGILLCNSAGDGVVCSAPQVTPGIEVCNGLDDDCDGFIDEDLGPPVDQACGGGSGCSGGTFQCVDPDNDPSTPNSSIECVGGNGGGPEVCNGIDDDCDNDIDEDVTDPTLGDSCTPPNITVCTPGTIICDNGELVCDGYTVPTTDICNGQDEDCDGEVDETNCAETAPPLDECVDGECLFRCENDEFPCPSGQYCKMFEDDQCDVPPCRFCVDDPCVTVTCDPGEACDPDTGACYDLCANVTCEGGETCVNGFCLDCFQLPCPDGQLCDLGTGCVDDPCDPNPCDPATQFCRDGDCVPLTCQQGCPQGQFCHDGTCREDLCADVSCSGNLVCNPFTGECVGDLCEDVFCVDGQACNPGTGECIDDPCATIDCPAGTECQVAFDGHGICVNLEPPDDDYVYAGGGGCRSTTGGGAGTGLLVLAVLAVVRRRRRAIRSIQE